MVRTLHVVHFFGREVSYLQRRVYHPELYLPGVFLHREFGEATFVRAAARVVLVSRIIFCTFDEAARLVTSCKRLRAACIPWKAADTYVKCRVTQEEWSEQKGYAPEVLFSGWPQSLMGHRMYIVVRRAAEVARSLWKISGYTCEFTEAVWNADPHTRTRAVEDLFIESQELYEKIIRSEQHLADVIEANKGLVNSTLKILNVSWTADDLVRVATSFSNKSEGVQKTCAKPIKKVTDFAKNTGQVTKTFFIPTQDRFWREES
jgi:hypothetical protein